MSCKGPILFSFVVSSGFEIICSSIEITYKHNPTYTTSLEPFKITPFHMVKKLYVKPKHDVFQYYFHIETKILLKAVFPYWSSVQSLSPVQLFATPWTTARQASLSITNSQSPPKPMSIELVMSSSHLILCCPLLLLPSILASIRVFPNESALCIRWPKYWSFSFNISPSNEHSGLISFRMDWLDLLAEQGTLKSLLQHHSLKASILRCSAFFIVQLSHSYMTTGKTSFN